VGNVEKRASPALVVPSRREVMSPNGGLVGCFPPVFTVMSFATSGSILKGISCVNGCCLECFRGGR
jgi:hypothetical protein